MKLALATTLPCDLADAVREVKKPSLLMYIAHPVVLFKPSRDTQVPDVWTEGTYWFQTKLFGILPVGDQAIRITLHEDGQTFRMHDSGYSRMIKRWDHWIIIHVVSGQTCYTDKLDLDAGILTPFVWLFAKVFFAHRQRRWVRLAKSGFDYAD